MGWQENQKVDAYNKRSCQLVRFIVKNPALNSGWDFYLSGYTIFRPTKEFLLDVHNLVDFS